MPYTNGAKIRERREKLRMNYRNVIGGVPAEPKFIRY